MPFHNRPRTVDMENSIIFTDVTPKLQKEASSLDVLGVTGEGSSEVCIFESSLKSLTQPDSSGDGPLRRNVPTSEWHGSCRSFVGNDSENSSSSLFNIPEKSDRVLRGRRERDHAIGKNTGSSSVAVPVVMQQEANLGLLLAASGADLDYEYTPDLISPKKNSRQNILIGREKTSHFNNFSRKESISKENQSSDTQTNDCDKQRSLRCALSDQKDDSDIAVSGENDRNLDKNSKRQATNEESHRLKPPQRTKTPREDDFMASMTSITNFGSLRRRDSVVPKKKTMSSCIVNKGSRISSNHYSNESLQELDFLETCNSLSSLSCITIDESDFNSSSGTVSLHEIMDGGSHSFPPSASPKSSPRRNNRLSRGRNINNGTDPFDVSPMKSPRCKLSDGLPPKSPLKQFELPFQSPSRKNLGNSIRCNSLSVDALYDESPKIPNRSCSPLAARSFARSIVTD